MNESWDLSEMIKRAQYGVHIGTSLNQDRLAHEKIKKD